MKTVRPMILGALVTCGASFASAVTLVLNPSADTYLRQDLPTQTSASGSEMLVGHIVSGTPEMRGLLTFDLSSLPANAVIDSVTLRLQRTEDTISQVATVSLQLHQVTEAFTASQASWNNRATGTPWTTAGGTFDSTVLASVSAATRSTADVIWSSSTGLVSAFQASYEGAGSISLLVLDPSISASTRELFRFRTNEAGASFAPELTLTYSIVPEPSAAALLAGCAGLALTVARRRRRV